MRYIGSKGNLLPQLQDAVNQRKTRGGIFCDIFSGTGTVANNFKPQFPIISNDFLFFSYLIQFAKIELNKRPHFSALKKIIGSDPITFLNSQNFDLNSVHRDPFIFNEFAPSGHAKRMYFSDQNALQIDGIRQTVEDWFTNGLINTSEFKYLTACLVEAVPSISNIAGTYGAFLKHWDKRAFNRLELQSIDTTDNRKKNKCHNRNGIELISEISGEVLYVDPPYNGRQYLGNYHVLETIAQYDYPELHGITGIRRDSKKSSDFCKAKTVRDAFNNLFANADFDYLIVSYSNEGLLPESELVSILERHTNPKKTQIFRHEYRRYSRVQDSNKTALTEIIISGAR